MQKKKAIPLIDSRHLKILSVKKDQLKDAFVFVTLNEEKYGSVDISMLRKLVEEIHKIEPTGVYFLGVRDYEVSFYDKAEMKGKEIIVTINHEHDVDKNTIEKEFKKALSGVKNISFIHHSCSIEHK